MEWGDQWWASSIVDKVMPWFTHLGSVVAVILFIVFSSILSKSRKLFYRLLLLYGIQSAILYGLKYLVGRQRPVLMEISSRISAGPGEILDPSFPSGHTLHDGNPTGLLVSSLQDRIYYHCLFNRLDPNLSGASLSHRRHCRRDPGVRGDKAYPSSSRSLVDQEINTTHL
jgi:hypothetical protein